ncbi:flagellar biosynthetic protein FliO [Massilia solisilvae]|uniref:Flagellar protein n=1 Tax=Massilia solisilvae TaxID=1811225 RepID=A0ABT2BF44_9BURK|nr:flagellar biosynthetic protein FliO [Massilia solisilvae]MCS0607036.1 flagellar biosynthetic protein FliO [Massilia solisilvae]
MAAGLCLPSYAQVQQPTGQATVASVPAAAPTAPQASAPAPAPAQTAPQATYQPPAAPAAGGLLQTLLALCFVLALLAGLAWLAKRFGPRAMGGTANLRIVGALSLGGRERVLVVEVADQWIVVGASPGRVSLLSTMPRQELPPSPPGMAASVPAGFGDWLKQTLEKRNAK